MKNSADYCSFKTYNGKNTKVIHIINRLIHNWLPWWLKQNLPAMQETQVQSLGWEDSGEGNGNPLQYSCLENPMDRGAWQAIVHGVTKGWTQLCSYHFTSLYFIYNYKRLKKVNKCHQVFMTQLPYCNFLILIQQVVGWTICSKQCCVCVCVCFTEKYMLDVFSKFMSIREYISFFFILLLLLFFIFAVNFVIH